LVRVAYSMYCSYGYALLATHCSPGPLLSLATIDCGFPGRFKMQWARIVVSNIPWFFISTECSSAETLLGSKSILLRGAIAWDDVVSKVAPREPEFHLEPLCWSFLTVPRRLRGCDGGLSATTSEPEAHFKSLGWSISMAPPRGCTSFTARSKWLGPPRELELHLEWSFSTAPSRSYMLSWLMGSCRLVISGGVGRDVKTWVLGVVNWKFLDRVLGEIVSCSAHGFDSLSGKGFYPFFYE
jgi:hypothetical protein